MKIDRCGDCEHIKLLPSSDLFGGQWVCGKTGEPVSPVSLPAVCELRKFEACIPVGAKRDMGIK